MKIALGLACFSAVFAFSYAYAFWLGGLFISKETYNSVYQRNYTSGDVLGCFFGVIFGLMSLTTTTNQLKGILEGRVAGKVMFDTIERKPEIQLDSESAKKHDL
jgi:hypothetical protein